jgi:putative redox protein
VASNTASVSMRWREQLVFEGGGPGRVPVVVDGDSRAGSSPVELLLLAGAACTGADIVPMLEKMRVTIRALDVDVEGTRRADHPRRFTAIHFRFRVVATGLDEPKFRRAVDLSLEKYCSVMASLASDIHVTYDVLLA